MHISTKLRQLREDAGLGVREAALKLNKTAGYLSRVEVKGEIPSPELLCAMAELYQADPAELLSLAKSQQLELFREQIDVRQSEALRLFRKKGSSRNE
jgi:transcriptional regulator with XRE-family HTH domain